MENLLLIVGLGNPGPEYAETRHNAGFLLLDRLAHRWGGAWRTESRFQARVVRVRPNARQIMLMQPQTFMNASGESVRAAAEYYQVAQERMVMVVDDADLPLGEIRLRPGGGTGGHHGLESVEKHLGTRDFARLRLGIGRQEPAAREITGHVLGRFTADERKIFEKVLDRAVDQVECWLTAGIGKAMSQFNGTVVDPAKQTT